MSRQRDSEAGWREVVRRQAGSGLSAAAFCRRSGIPPVSFYAWRRKLRVPAPFTEVRVAPDSARSLGPGESDPSRQDGGLRLLLARGRTIVVRPGFDRTTLLALVDALEHDITNGGIAEVAAGTDAPAPGRCATRRGNTIRERRA